MSKALSTEMRPSYLSTQTENFGTEEFGAFIRPPRLKIVQPSSRAPLKGTFKEGDTSLVPSLRLVAAHKESFKFTPIFFFPEWAIWNPLQAQGLPVIRERSFDPRSPIAVASRDPKTRSFPCPENKQFNCTNQEMLNLAVIIHGIAGMERQPAVLSFKGGEIKTGAMLLDLIRTRNAPICSMVIEGSVGDLRRNEYGEWYGFSFDNPGENPWVPQEDFEMYTQLHNSLKEAHANQAIIVDHDDRLDTPAEDESGKEF